MAKDSSAIITGELGPLVTQTVDDGGSPGGETIPTAIYEFRPAARSKGEELTPVIKIATVDVRAVATEDAPNLVPGQRYVMFVERVTEEDRGGLPGLGTIWVPVSGIAGVFDIEEDEAKAMDPSLASISNEPAPKRVGGRLVVSPSSLLALTPGA